MHTSPGRQHVAMPHVRRDGVLRDGDADVLVIRPVADRLLRVRATGRDAAHREDREDERGNDQGDENSADDCHMATCELVRNPLRAARKSSRMFLGRHNPDRGRTF